MEHTQSSIKDSSLAEIRDYVAYFLLFSIPFTIFALLFSLPPIIVGTQIRGHVALGFVPCTFYREKISALYSLVDSRRIVLTHARRSQLLILFFFLRKRYSSCRYNERQLIDVTVVRRVRLRAEQRSCDTTTH